MSYCTLCNKTFEGTGHLCSTVQTIGPAIRLIEAGTLDSAFARLAAIEQRLAKLETESPTTGGPWRTGVEKRLAAVEQRYEDQGRALSELVSANAALRERIEKMEKGTAGVSGTETPPVSTVANSPVPGAAPETPAQHFKRCGPMCTHVELCRDCANVFGLCDRHKGNPDGTYSWKPTPAAGAAPVPVMPRDGQWHTCPTCGIESRRHPPAPSPERCKVCGATDDEPCDASMHRAEEYAKAHSQPAPLPETCAKCGGQGYKLMSVGIRTDAVHREPCPDCQPKPAPADDARETARAIGHRLIMGWTEGGLDEIAGELRARDARIAREARDSAIEECARVADAVAGGETYGDGTLSDCGMTAESIAEDIRSLSAPSSPEKGNKTK